MISSKWRGHTIIYKNSVWVYSDTKETVTKNPARACGNCGKGGTKEGHDNCLGTIGGVMNACCGHGSDLDAYVQLLTGEVIQGKGAINKLKELKIGPV